MKLILATAVLATLVISAQATFARINNHVATIAWNEAHGVKTTCDSVNGYSRCVRYATKY